MLYNDCRSATSAVGVTVATCIAAQTAQAAPPPIAPHPIASPMVTVMVLLHMSEGGLRTRVAV